VRGFALDPLLNGEEPAECGNLRAFGGELMGADIGEFGVIVESSRKSTLSDANTLLRWDSV
jgi:hypothetical protein